MSTGKSYCDESVTLTDESCNVMILFYTDRVDSDWAFFSPEESQHLIKVLRKKAGAKIHFVDGTGGRYVGELFESGKKGTSVKIIDKKQEPILQPNIHLAIAPTKNITRFEWFLEKATEIGISKITPILTHQSERRHIRVDRLEKILAAAMKQSLKSYLPVLAPLVDVKAFLDQIKATSDPTEKYIAYLQDDVKSHLKDNYASGNDVIIMVGPEGGFTELEAQQAVARGFKTVSLGPHRLRTETAGIVATHIINLMNE